MRHRLVFAASVLIALTSTAVLASSQTYTTLDPPNSNYAIVYAISANGTIAGFYERNGSSREESFVINPAGVYAFYSIPYGYSTEVYAVNNFGSTTGKYYFGVGGGGHEYARGATGKIEYLDPPRQSYTPTEFGGINNLNQVTGTYVDSSGLDQGFVANLFGNLTLFDVPGASSTFGGRINDSGVIDGLYYVATDRADHAFVRDQFGNITAFDVPGAGTGVAQGTAASGINSSGEIVGYYVDSGYNYHGFLRAPDGTITTFDAPDAGTGDGYGTLGLGINDAGQITGFYVDSSTVIHGFLRDQYGNITEFAEPNAGTGINQGTYAYGIGNTGIIVGYYYDSSSNIHAFKRQ
jgi:hypothetical protein